MTFARVGGCARDKAVCYGGRTLEWRFTVRRKARAMKTVYGVFLGVLLLATAAQAQVYRWVDANGRTVFSDQPPPQGRRAETVKLRPQPAAAASPASAPAVNGDIPQQVKQLNERIDEHNRKIKQENCSTARSHLAKLESLTQPNAATKAAPQSAATLSAAIAAARDHVRTWCGN